MTGVDPDRVSQLMAREMRAFAEAHPRSASAFERARRSLLDGGPMDWMAKWRGGYPVLVEMAAELAA